MHHLSDRLLGVTLTPGKRGNFDFGVDVLRVEPAIRSLAEKERRREVGIEERPTWLVAHRIFSTSTGRFRDRNVTMRTIFGVSKHALKRLVQRANCCTAADLHTAVTAAFPPLLVVERSTVTERKERGADAWMVPVQLPTMDEPMVFIVSGPSAGDNDTLFFVRTVYPLEFLNEQERHNVLRLHAMLTAHKFDLFALVENHRAEYVALLEAVRRLAY
jgi:hypothetical protein